MMPNAKGIDVSHHNGVIDWSRVASDGIDFAFMKATESTGFTDPKFASNWAKAKAAGISRGAYHFFKPSKDGTIQAQQFLSHVQPVLQSGDLRPVVDVENYDGSSLTKFLKELQEYLDVVEAAVGAKPIIYTFKSFWEHDLKGPTTFGSYPLWIVDLSHTPPRLPVGWTNFTFHQTSFHGTVKGIHGATDLDVFNGTAAGLSAMKLP
jgi:lysozyme